YNNKIKRVSPKDKSSETFLGTGKEGLTDGKDATFDEPNGVSIAFGKLYIADTNNHAIRVADLKTRKVETIQFKSLEKLRPRARMARFAGESIEAAAQTVEPGDAEVTLLLELPKGYKLNPQAPTALSVASAQKEVVSFKGEAEQTFRNPAFPVTVPINATEGETTVNANFVVYYCEAGKESLCYFKEARLTLPIKVKKGAGNRKLTAVYKLKLEGDR
ncbi:MAG TPA: hypothetical protein VNO70_12040, partial [Blastocatellia bacterium]|nr:hypothetical protein [Blastocatellia bacterium]